MKEACRVTSVFLAMAVAACGTSDAHRAIKSSAAIDAPEARKPFLLKVDHFFATSANAEEQFNFFRDTLGLAVAWPYKRYGDFASGGLTAGNTAMEFVTWAVAKGDILPTEWKSLAFEPVGDTEAALTELEKRGINHSTPDVTHYKNSTGKEVGLHLRLRRPERDPRGAQDRA